MFFTYLKRELRSRYKQALVVAVGLGIGIGLVVTVSATSSGVKTAQATVLHSLYGVGTDISVTQTATRAAAGPQHFGFGGTSGGTAPAAGSSFSRNTLRPTVGQGEIKQSKCTEVGKLHDVSEATCGLSLSETAVSGTFGAYSGSSSGAAAASPGSSGGAAPNFNVSSTTIDGIQPSAAGVGPISPTDITSGKYFTSSDNHAKVAILNSTYARQKSLKVGSSVTVKDTSFKVIGIAKVPGGSTGSDIYLPLGEAQTLASLSGKVTTVYVSVASAGDVSTVQAEIQKLLPSATVTTSATLAKEVTGSLGSATSLATELGKWLSILALIVAFIVAGLLMVAAVSRRVREFGTLKAIGWRTRRIVGQVMGEGLVQGLAGGVVGVLLGVAGAGIVSAIAPGLTATTGSPSATGNGFAGGGAGPGGSGGFAGVARTPGSAGGATRPGGFGSGVSSLSHTITVHLTAPLQGSTILLAIGLAIVGGLIAGAFGSWRASRLRPADALRRVE